MWIIIADILLVIVLAVGIWSQIAMRSYFSTYGGEKGKNLATHEDIERIVEDLRRTTKATEEIKIQLSSEVWNRQREWEMKREVVFDTAKAVGAINSAIIALDVSLKHRNPGDGTWTADNLRVRQAWDSAADVFETIAIRVAIVCKDTTYDVVCAFSEMAHECARLLGQSRGTEANQLFPELERLHYAVINTLRGELGLETKPQST